MIEKNEFHTKHNSKDEMNDEFLNKQWRDKSSRKKKQSGADEYDLKILMDDYYLEHDQQH